MKMITCAFTGHRPHKFPWRDSLTISLTSIGS